MRPMIKRITYKMRYNLRPFQELVVTRLSAGNIFLRNAERTHCTPLVMVAAEPKLRNIFRCIVFVNLLWGKMAMPIENLRFFRTPFVYFLCRFCSEQEILIHKFFHNRFPFTLRI